MPESYVKSAMIKGGKIAVSVLVDDFKDYQFVEISGQATQTDGGFANFYEIAQIPAIASPDGSLYVEVTATPIPPNRFRRDQDISVVLRVATIWLTVVGRQAVQQQAEQQQQQGQQQQGQQQGQGPEPASMAYEGMIWDDVKKVSQLSGYPFP